MKEKKDLLEQLKIDEGLRLVSYRCTAGVWTIGYGHNLAAHPDPAYPAQAGTTCTIEQADAWLRQDVHEAEDAMLIRWPWVDDLPTPVYLAVLNVCFNIGPNRLAGFVNALDALKAHSFGLAAEEFRSSKWYLQVGSRAKRIVALIRSGGR